MNKAILIGTIGSDPEKKYTQGGQCVVKFRMATTERFTSNGEKREQTEWHNIEWWGKAAENVHKYLEKGGRVAVEGRIQYRTWDDKDGKKRYNTDIVIQHLELLGSKSGGNHKQRSSESDDGGNGSERRRPTYDGGDDIPF